MNTKLYYSRRPSPGERFRSNKQNIFRSKFWLVRPTTLKSAIFPVLIRFFHFHASSYPYNWRTPSGYLVTLFIVTIKFYYMGTIYLCILCIMAGIGEFLIAFARDFEHNVTMISDEIVQCSKLSDQWPIKSNNDKRIKPMLKQLIQFHCDSRQ